MLDQELDIAGSEKPWKVLCLGLSEWEQGLLDQELEMVEEG